MYTLGPDEKATLIMAYTQTSLIRGEVVTRENSRVSIWLRMDGVPEFLAIHKASLIHFSAAQPRQANHEEIMVPTTSLVGFHIAPPARDELDYDVQESNRINTPIGILMGAFTIKGHIRLPAQLNATTKIATARMPWMSIYEAEITLPQFPQMPAIQVPMLIVRPAAVSFVIS